MKILNAFLLTSAHHLKQLPEAQLPEFAMVGRSNVGKSSFINGLLQRRLAHTSNTPGKTRLMNFYVVRGELRQRPLEFCLVDLPGYGYARMSKTDRAHWSQVLQRFLKSRVTLRRIVQLVDIRHGMLDNDLEMFHWLVEEGFPVWLVLTKSDKLSRSQAAGQVLAIRRSLLPSPDALFSFSATDLSQGPQLGGSPAGREPFLEHLADQVWAPDSNPPAVETDPLE